MTKETRTFDAQFEVRSEGDSTVIEGHAAVFERESQDLGGFVERCAPGAFAATLGDDVRALINHDPNLVLGRTSAGTLNLSEDSTGLLFRNTLPGTSYARDLAISLARGDISQCSFSFAVNEEEWGYNTQDLPLRTLRSVKLYDVGPVTFPAYLATDVAFSRAMESVSERAGHAVTLDELMPKRTVVNPNAALRMRLDLMRRVMGH
jgi:HK97 family phage prohead protease